MEVTTFLFKSGKKIFTNTTRIILCFQSMSCNLIDLNGAKVVKPAVLTASNVIPRVLSHVHSVQVNVGKSNRFFYE